MELMNRAIAETRKYIDMANKKWGLNMHYPTISFDLRGAVAGQAWYSKYLIKYNKTLLMQYGEEFIKETIAHEVAHLIVRAKFGLYSYIKPHGYEWRVIMMELGANPNRCHSFDVTKARVVKANYLYACACKEWHFTATRHRRATMAELRGKRSYSCPRCRTPIRKKEKSVDMAIAV